MPREVLAHLHKMRICQQPALSRARNRSATVVVDRPHLPAQRLGGGMAVADAASAHPPQPPRCNRSTNASMVVRNRAVMRVVFDHSK